MFLTTEDSYCPVLSPLAHYWHSLGTGMGLEEILVLEIHRMVLEPNHEVIACRECFPKGSIHQKLTGILKSAGVYQKQSPLQQIYCHPPPDVAS